MYDSPARYDSAATESHKKTKKGRPCKAVAKTASEYSSASSIHGFAYIFEPAHGPFLRVLWLAVVLGMAAVGVYLSIQVRYFKLYLPGSTSTVFAIQIHQGLRRLAGRPCSDNDQDDN